ncbi:glycine--tRNA ligase subunit alpha [Candidatus Vidania fulgoroideorum]
MIFKLIKYLEKLWGSIGFKNSIPSDLEVGAATLNFEMIKKSIKKKFFKYYFIQKCRRPYDFNIFYNENRLYIHNQFQVLIKPAKKKYIYFFLKTLKKIGLYSKSLVEFKKDNWNNISIGAFGRGWEVKINLIEISQITIFDSIMNKKLKNNVLEITYGLDRICYLLGKNNNLNQSIDFYNYSKIKKNNLHILFYFLKNNLLFCLRNKIKYVSYDILFKMLNYYNIFDFNSNYVRSYFLNLFKKYSYKIEKILI